MYTYIFKLKTISWFLASKPLLSPALTFRPVCWKYLA